MGGNIHGMFRKQREGKCGLRLQGGDRDGHKAREVGGTWSWHMNDNPLMCFTSRNL